MAIVEELFISLVYCNRCNRDTSVKVSSFFTLVSTFQFVACLVLTKSVLDMTLPVTQLVQSTSIDICDGLNLTEPLEALVITRR